MNSEERIKMVKAMEYIARMLNNIDLVYDVWLACGVADGDIEYGDLTVKDDDINNLDYYISDNEFSELMGLFLRLMKYGLEDGGLYCDGIVSEGEESN